MKDPHLSWTWEDKKDFDCRRGRGTFQAEERIVTKEERTMKSHTVEAFVKAPRGWPSAATALAKVCFKCVGFERDMLISHFSRCCKPYPWRKFDHQKATNLNSIISASHRFTFTELRLMIWTLQKRKKALIRRMFSHLLQNHTPCGHCIPILKESEEDFFPPWVCILAVIKQWQLCNPMPRADLRGNGVT